jgi:hypothetical protein
MGLPHDAKPLAGKGGFVRRCMPLAGLANEGQVMIKRKVVADPFLSGAAVVKLRSLLPEKEGFIANASGKTILVLSPVEGLTAFQRHPEIELRALDHAGIPGYPHRAK